MKIAFLTPEYPHPKVNHAAGLGTSIKNLAMSLVREGVNVTVFVYGQDSDEIFEEDGVHFHLIEDKKYRFGKWFFYRKYIQNYVNKVVSQEGIQLLEAPDWTGITAFMTFKIPVVIRFHGSDTYFCYLEKRAQKWKNHWFETLAVKNADAYIAPTVYAGKVSAELFGIVFSKVTVIHYGLELEKFKNPNPEKFDKGMILYMGTLIRKKGVLELPAIFRKVREQYPDAKLILIGGDSPDIQTGDNSTWKLMKNEINEEDINHISYLGKMPYHNIQEYVQKAQVCVFPTFAETLGMVTIESMAMQKPVVNSNIGWAQELLVDNDSGFLVHPSDHQQYADKIVELLKSEQLCSFIGENAHKRVESIFDIQKIVKENIAFYESIIQ